MCTLVVLLICTFPQHQFSETKTIKCTFQFLHSVSIQCTCGAKGGFCLGSKKACPGCCFRLITSSCITVPSTISPDSTNQPLCVLHILTSSFYKPQGQGKQIEPISGVEIALKITTANVEMYYLHPPNPIYFMHILPSKLNTACSLCGKSL